MLAQHPFLDHDGVLALAHRGGAGAAPENTMAAFAAAVEMGYRYIETDVQVTRDAVVVAFHDDRLDRLTGRTGVVAELDYIDLTSVRVGSREPIPRLEEVLRTWPDLRVNIDPKTDASIEPLIELIERTGCLERVCIGSFSHRRLRRLRSRFGYDLCTSMSPLEVGQLRFGLWFGRQKVGPMCVQVSTSFRGFPIVDKRFMAACGHYGLPVHVWTINDPAEMQRLLDMGVDGIVTDNLSALKDILKGRGLWQ